MAENEPQAGGTGEDGGTPDMPSGGSAGKVLKNKQVVIPVAAGLATAAAVLGAKKGAGAVGGAASKLQEKGQETAQETAENAGKAGVEGAKEALKDSVSAGPVGKLASKVFGGGKGDRDSKTRRLPIQRWTDVAVPVEEAYEKWVDFEEYPKFMHRVVNVEHADAEGDEPEKVKWEEKIWFSKRQWEAEVTEREENDRIAWRTLSGTNHSGVVSFHRLDDNLTRVLVTVDFRPAGIIEKMGSGLRFAKRAVQADLARFKAYVELGREATGEEPEAREQREQQEEQEKQEKQDGGQTEGSSDGADEPDDDTDRAPSAASGSGGEADEDPEEARREREQRRAERRERVSAS